MNKINPSLKEVTKSDCTFLYELLSEREPTANISHREMPTYENHIKFVMSKPYSKWYIIIYNKKKVGSIYLSKQDEIGIFIKKGMQEKGIGMKALKILMSTEPRKRFLANISPKNKKSIQFFKKNGFKLIQYTYELINSNKK
jgi:RimJ/RimL family protein N-acetyltransferase